MSLYQKEDKIDFKGFWSRLLYLVKPSYKQIKYLAFFAVILEMLEFVGPYLLKLIIDLITNFQEENITIILGLILTMFIVYQIIAILIYFSDKRVIDVLSDIEKYLPVQAHKKMLELSLSYHEKENTGNKISKIQRGVDKIIQLLGNVLWDVGPTIMQLVLTVGILFVVDYRFGLLLLLFAPAFLIITIRANRKAHPYRVKRHDDYEESAGMMAQSIININTVKSFVQEKREEKEYYTIVDYVKKNIFKEFNIIFKHNWGRNLVIDLGRTSILLFGVYLVWLGGISIGSLVFVVTISEKALISLFRISRLYDRMMESSEAIDRLFYLDQEESNIKNPINGLKPKNIAGRIEFKDVDFIYDEAKNKALDNINLKINSGCVTALVGPSGGGKTTVARMVYRHYDPQKGEVFLDGKSLKEYDLYAFRKFIAIVPQEVEVFNSSIRDNISYANPEASLKEIKAAARIANAEEFIKNLAQGYNTLVGERGIKLSGGQRQRVGIARAILANPRILIFDEATSNLDSQSERLIQDAMEKISKGRTTIIIAHRLSTIQKADKIVVLDNGRVQEEGNHYELAHKKGGVYSELLELQKMGDVE